MEASDTVAGERKYPYGLWLSVKWFVFSVADDENGRVLSRVKDWFANDLDGFRQCITLDNARVRSLNQNFLHPGEYRGRGVEN
jgi:hypothetical protein